MERGALVAEARLAGAQLTKVLRGLRSDTAVQTDLDAASRLATDLDVHVDGGRDLCIGRARLGHELREEVEHRRLTTPRRGGSGGAGYAGREPESMQRSGRESEAREDELRHGEDSFRARALSSSVRHFVKSFLG